MGAAPCGGSPKLDSCVSSAGGHVFRPDIWPNHVSFPGVLRIRFLFLSPHGYLSQEKLFLLVFNWFCLSVSSQELETIFALVLEALEVGESKLLSLVSSYYQSL